MEAISCIELCDVSAVPLVVACVIALVGEADGSMIVWVNGRNGVFSLYPVAFPAPSPVSCILIEGRGRSFPSAGGLCDRASVGDLGVVVAGRLRPCVAV